MRFSILVILLFTVSLVQAASIYRWVDKSGKVHVSDQPPPTSARQVNEFETSAPVVSDDLPYATRLAAQRFPVTLYMNSCGEVCGKARAFLIKRGIPYTMKNPESSQAIKDELKQHAGSLQVPTLLVGTHVAKGFSEADWGDLLDSAGYPRFAGAKARDMGVQPASAPTTAPAPTTSKPMEGY